MIQEGYYDGEILDAWTELESSSSDNLVMCFEVRVTLPDGNSTEGVCRHFTAGDYGAIGEAVLKTLEVDWPAGLRCLAGQTRGKKVRVKVKHKKADSTGETFVNWYIVTKAAKKPASDTQIEMAIAKLEAKASAKPNKGDLPF